MESITSEIAAIPWEKVKENMHDKGYCVVPDILTAGECEQLVASYSDKGLFRKKIIMERYRFGLGEYKYFDYPLPQIIQSLREIIYPELVPIANSWMNVLKTNTAFPSKHSELLDQCRLQGQNRSTVLLLKYGEGGFNTLHQDLYGEVYFPMQCVLFLNEPEEDYTGGEFVLTQQIPRAQSKAIVLRPRKGDMLLFTTNFRPVKGKKGYYRANMKHGVSEVLSGERHTVGIIFHDSVS